MSKHVTSITWDEAVHLTPEAKEDLWESIPPYQRKARSKGIPSLGSGAIYPVDEEDLVVKPFAIPDHWPRAYGLDVGWKKTAAIWAAQNPENQVNYLYDEYYRGEAEPVIHTEAIKARGAWIPGVIDPASRGRAQKDGIRLFTLYREMGLDLKVADHAVHAGIHLCWTLMTADKLKVFSNCTNWLEEFRVYRRDEDGKIVKERDHLLDGFRYLMMSGRDRMITEPALDPDEEEDLFPYRSGPGEGSWMGK